MLPANTGERTGAWVLLERLKASPLSQTMALIRAEERFAVPTGKRRYSDRLGINRLRLIGDLYHGAKSKQ